MKLTRSLFGIATGVLLVLALWDGAANNRRSLYDGPYIGPEFGCAVVSIVLSGIINDRKKAGKK